MDENAEPDRTLSSQQQPQPQRPAPTKDGRPPIDWRLPAPRGPKSPAERVLVIVLLAGFWLLAVSSVLQKSAAFEETAQLTAGRSYWLREDFRLHADGAYVTKRWAALPFIRSLDRFPGEASPAWQDARAYPAGHEFLHRSGNDMRTMLLHGRAMMALLAAALCWLVYRWSRALFGVAAGLLSLALCVLAPNLLAHGRLITADVPAALFMLLATGCLWMVLHRLTLLTLAAGCAAAALLFLATPWAVLIVPVAAALVLIRVLGRTPLRTGFWYAERMVHCRGARCVIFAVVLLLHAGAIGAAIWGAYGFRYGPSAAGEGDPFGSWRHLAENTPVVRAALEAARARRLLPEAYLHGLSMADAAAAKGSAVLAGPVSATLAAHHLALTLPAKTPLPTMLLALLALSGAAVAFVAGRYRSLRSRCRRLLGRLYRTAPLWALLATYGAVVAFAGPNVGLRNVLPIYPAAFILAGTAARWVYIRRRWAQAAIAAAAAWLVVATLLCWPNFLPYMNLAVGGPARGWESVFDCSRDLGQDLPALRGYLHRNGLDDPGRTPVYLAYFGSDDPACYGIRCLRLPGYILWPETPIHPYPSEAGVYCVSAALLRSDFFRDGQAWSQAREEGYLQGLEELRKIQQMKDDPSFRRTMEDNPHIARSWEKNLQEAAAKALRLARQRSAALCRALRSRRPDTTINHTIFVYRVSADDVRRALDLR